VSRDPAAGRQRPLVAMERFLGLSQRNGDAHALVRRLLQAGQRLRGRPGRAMHADREARSKSDTAASTARACCAARGER